MLEKTLCKVLDDALDGCKVSVSGDGHHFDATIIGECFEGLRKVARQQLVYKVIADYIQSGELHAVNIHAFTPSEYADK